MVARLAREVIKRAHLANVKVRRRWLHICLQILTLIEMLIILIFIKVYHAFIFHTRTASENLIDDNIRPARPSSR